MCTKLWRRSPRALTIHPSAAGSRHRMLTRCRSGERGMVTFELAVGILSATFMAGVLCWVIAVVGVQIRCNDTATEIARQTARGDQAAVQRARAGAPKDAQVQVENSGADVEVMVTTEMRWGKIGPLTVSGSARVTEEPGTRRTP